jgi:HEAT repeat protein
MMLGKWIRQTTGVLWPTALMHVMFWLTICLLIGALTPVAVAALGKQGIVQAAGTMTSTTQVAQATTYRYVGQPNGTTEVQRSQDGGLTWLAVGMIPEPVAQLAVNPANDTVVVARTGTNLWRSGNSGVSWARLDALPGRPLSLAFSGGNEPTGLIFAGTDTQGLYSSLDSGTTWQAAGGPLSPVGAGSLAVTALVVNPGDQHVIYTAATFTMVTPEGQHSVQSVFISVNDGRRWFEMTPAPRFDPLIPQLIPLNGSLLAVLLAAPFGSPMASLAITPALIKGLDDADAGTRAATARALGLSQDRSLLPVLMNHLHDPDLLAGDQVARAIGRLGDPAAVHLLMPVLSDTDEIIRARAATALGLLQTQEAIPQLTSMLQHDGAWARRCAAEALATIGTPEAIVALIGPLRDAELTPVRYMAMQGLEMVGQAAITPLRLALLDTNPVIRRNAAEMLGWLRAANAVPNLVRSLSDRDATVRTQAAWALGEIHTAPAQLALRQLANGEVGRPILQPDYTAARATAGYTAPARQTGPGVRAAVPGALAWIVLNRWTLGALTSLVALALLAAMIILFGKGSGRHFRPS